MSRGWGVESVSTSIAPGITKNDSSSTAPEAVSQPINGGAAQDSGQLLMGEGKSCSPGGASHPRRNDPPQDPQNNSTGGFVSPPPPPRNGPPTTDPPTL